MGRHKGSTKTGGRQKGTTNRVTALLKDSILLAAEEAGNKSGLDDQEGVVAYLTKQAIDNPGPFMSLLGTVLPLQIAGDPDAPLVPNINITYVSPNGTYTDVDGTTRNVKDEKVLLDSAGGS